MRIPVTAIAIKAPEKTCERFDSKNNLSTERSTKVPHTVAQRDAGCAGASGKAFSRDRVKNWDNETDGARGCKAESCDDCR